MYSFDEELTRDEAIASARKGNKITHRYFTPDEWFIIHGDLMRFEDNVSCTIEEFYSTRTDVSWRDGYAVWKEKEVKND